MDGGGIYRPPEFSPDGAALDLNEAIRSLHLRGCPSTTNTRPIGRGLPILGVYGKVGAQKGSFVLVRSLSVLARQGVRLQAVVVGGGPQWAAFVDAVAQAGIGDTAWTLQFLAAWRIPELIRACDARSFLEREFEVVYHSPSVVGEVLACGVPLVVSGGIVARWPALRDRPNSDVAADPADELGLADILEAAVSDATRAKVIGQAGLAAAPPPGVDIGGRDEAAITMGLRGNEWGEVGEAALELLRRRCPATRERFGPALDGVVRSTDPGLDPVIAACQALDQLPSLSDDAAHELVRLERILLWVGTDQEGVSGLSTFPGPVHERREFSTWTPEQVDALRPVVSRRALVDTFSMNMGQAARFIERADVPAPALHEGAPPQLYLVRKLPTLEWSRLRVDAAAGTFFALCDGTRTVREIKAAVAGQAATEQRQRQLGLLVERLYEMRVIAFRRGPNNAATALSQERTSLASR